MSEEKKTLNFIEQIIEEDLANGFPKDKLKFRFPPEPNGYLHLGHAKAICLNFGLGQQYNAPVNLRFDDTNPAKEEEEYVNAIRTDLEWLGFKWAEERYASDYFQQLYDWAVVLINKELAYVDEQDAETINKQRKTPTEPGIPSPFRDRPIEENLALFEKMKNGEFEEGTKILRAKVDMSSPNMHMRDPIMYRILDKAHHRTGTTWKIYPTYDWAHGESDYLEDISHSLCSLEFKHHRPLYEWYLEHIFEGGTKNKQREFARGNVGYTITSKRKLLRLIEEGHVQNWDDPRMPTLSGLRRRGFTPESIIKFWNDAGIAKRDNVIDVARLEHAVRDHLNSTAPRINAVLNPIRLVITNYPEGEEEWLVQSYGNGKNAKSRKVPFSREIYIEQDDFKEEANRKFFRLTLGKEVRLRGAYIIKGESVDKDENGNATTIYCTYDTDSKSGSGTEASNRKVKGTIHWVSIAHAIKTKVNLYDRLFTIEAPESDKEKDYTEFLNPDSLIETTAFIEPSIKDVKAGDRFQFQRIGYFCVDTESTPENIIFNRTVTLRDSWAKKN